MVIESDLTIDRRALLEIGDPKGDIGPCCFAVLEVCGGCGGISKYTRRYGLRTGPVLEIKKGWDLFAGGVFMWLFRMCLAGRIWLLVLEPPCTTFSIARCPKLRTIAEAEGKLEEQGQEEMRRSRWRMEEEEEEELPRG